MVLLNQHLNEAAQSMADCLTAVKIFLLIEFLILEISYKCIFLLYVCFFNVIGKHTSSDELAGLTYLLSTLLLSFNLNSIVSSQITIAELLL